MHTAGGVQVRPATLGVSLAVSEEDLSSIPPPSTCPQTSSLRNGAVDASHSGHPVCGTLVLPPGPAEALGLLPSDSPAPANALTHSTLGSPAPCDPAALVLPEPLCQPGRLTWSPCTAPNRSLPPAPRLEEDGVSRRGPPS